VIGCVVDEELQKVCAFKVWYCGGIVRKVVEAAWDYGSQYWVSSIGVVLVHDVAGR